MDNIVEREIKSEESDVKKIWKRIRTRNFSGNMGLAIKNSIYQFLTQMTQRFAALILTVILARILMPDLFGLYNLALSTIIIFTTFAELGIGYTLITFISKSLGRKNKSLAKATLYYLGKIKLFLILVSIVILLASARLIANTYYQKPVFLALVAGSLYILFYGIVSFFQSALQSFNNFKGIFFNEVVFQISRLILIPLAAILTLKYALSDERVLFYIFIAFGAAYFISSLFITFFQYRRKNPFLHERTILQQKQKNKIKSFFIGATALSFSGIFFGYIDKIILGRFVAGEFIGYYSAAFSLVGALSVVIGFGTALLPIFSRLDRKGLERGVNKSIKMSFLISILAFLGIMILAYPAIILIYGQPYSPAINMLRASSLLLFIIPLISIYSSYFMSRGKPQILTTLLVISTIINLGLNYFLVTYLLRFGELMATYGAIMAVILSNIIYLLGMFFLKKRIK